MYDLYRWAGRVIEAGMEAGLDLALGPGALPRPDLAPTPRDTVFREGTARLYRFRRPDDAPAPTGLPLLLVPSLINRWYVLDLRRGGTLAGHLVAAGYDVFLLDWGIPEDEDRYLDWDEVLARLARMVRRTKRLTGAPRLGLLGYCMGATLTGIHLALEPGDAAAFVNLAGPFDFSHAGCLGRMVDRRWFDAGAIADAGNVSPQQMESGFTGLRPTAGLAKLLGLPDLVGHPDRVERFLALEAWARDNIPFPAEAYRTYIGDLYQRNALVAGTHHARGRRVDLKDVTCPILSITADRDVICPVPAATALLDASGSQDTESITVPGGHVGAVVGSRAARKLYPAIAEWLRPRLAS